MSEIIKKGRDSFVAAYGHCGCGKIKCPQCSTELHHRDQGGGR